MEQNKVVIVLLHYHEVSPEYLRLRSMIIQKILKAADEFCSKVKTIESFVDPSEIVSLPTSGVIKSKEMSSVGSVPKSLSELSQLQSQSHIRPTSHLSLIPLSEIATAIVDGKTAVVRSEANHISLTPCSVLSRMPTLDASTFQSFSKGSS